MHARRRGGGATLLENMMPWTRRLFSLNLAPALFLAGVGRLTRCGGDPAPLDDAAMAALYAEPLPPPDRPLTVFHLGHSLVGRDMPAMLEQLAPSGHDHASQLGWGTTLMAHWEPDVEINGFEVENDHPRYRDARVALSQGAYDAFVMTEMVEIRDAIRYFDSAEYLHRWATHARAGNPRIRLYLYETWHNIDDEEGWLTRLKRDLERYWEGDILRRALARAALDPPIHLIPAGQVFARFTREIEARGGVDGLRRPADLFARRDDGSQDTIHVNDLGAYLVALTHYAVLYHRSTIGLPRALHRADGRPAHAPGPRAARLMQQVVDDVVTGLPLTGVRILARD